jgi:Concanavalin A-like lectin/glucanases superfamily
MAKTLYFTDVTPPTHRGNNDVGLFGGAQFWYPKRLSEFRGVNISGGTGATGNTYAGPINGVEYYSAMALEWISDPLAADFTIAGTITANLWASESDMNANIAINFLVEKIDGATGVLTQIVKSARVTEMALTTATVQNFTATPTSTACKRGDRLRVRIFMDDAGTMGAGFTSTFWYDRQAVGVQGDSWIQFTENLQFSGSPGSGLENAAVTSSEQTIGDGPATIRITQPFFATATTIDEIYVRLNKTGTPADNFIIEIQSDSAGNPSGTVVAAVATIAGPSMAANVQTNYTFSNLGITGLTVGTLYHLVFRRSGAVDGVNYYMVAVAPGKLASNGPVSYYNGSSWILTTSPCTPLRISGTKFSTYYLTDTASDVSGALIEKAAAQVRGSVSVSSTTNTVSGPTAGVQITNSAGGTALEWYTPPLLPITIGGAAKFNIRAAESASYRTSLRAEIAIVNNDGSGAVVWGSTCIEGLAAYGGIGEISTAGDKAHYAWVAGAATAVADGKRLRFRIYLDDCADFAIGAGQTATITYNGATADAAGDTWVALPLVVTEKSTGPSPVTDSGVGSDITSAFSFPALDSSAGNDITSAFTFPADEVGAGSEVSSLATATPIPITESGVGADAVADRAIVTTDVGTSGDISSYILSYSTEAGTGSDTSTLSAGAVPVSAVDSGTDSEISTLVFPVVSVVDFSTETDISVLSVSYLVTDSSVGSDVVSGKTVPTVDIGTGNEISILIAQYVTTDTGIGSETTGKIVATTDTGVGNEISTLAVAPYAVVDSSVGVDTSVLSIGIVPVSATDTGAGSEVSTISTKISVTEVPADLNTVLLLHSDGADGSTTFSDSSSSAHPIVPVGNAQIDTAQFKFGGSSVLLDGVDDLLQIPDSNDFHFGIGDWTIDFWIRYNDVTTSSYSHFYIYDNQLGDNFIFNLRNTASFWFLEYSLRTANTTTGSGSISLGAAPNIGQWYHYALVRNGLNIILFVDGVNVGLYSDMPLVAGSDNLSPAAPISNIVIGNYPGSSYGVNGWMDEIRVSKGVARWTSNFTPPVAPYDLTTPNGVDVSTLIRPTIPVSASDSGSGSEFLSITYSTTDTGTGSEISTLIATLVGTADTAIGVETSGKAVTTVDSGVGTEVSVKTISVVDAGTDTEISTLIFGIVSVVDSGTGAEISSFNTIRPVFDSGIGNEISILTISVISVVDSGAGTEISTANAAYPVTELGTGSDASSKIITPVDTGTGSEVSTLTTSVISVVDSGTGTEISLPLAISTPESGAGTEVSTLLAKSTVTDGGVGSDVSSVVKPASFSLVESGVATEVSTISAKISVFDSGAGSDSSAISPKISVFDTCTGADLVTLSYATGINLVCSYTVAILTRTDLTCTFTITVRGTADLVVTYSILNVTQKDLTCTWTITGPVRTDLVITYTIFGPAPIITGIITKAVTVHGKFTIVEKAQGIITRQSLAKVKERVYAKS